MTARAHIANACALRQLECDSWGTEDSRRMYSTPLTPGFPWYTVPSTPTSPQTRRHVIPYEYTFKVFVKGRWVGRRLVSVYSEELPHHSRAYYEMCLRLGRLRCIPRRVLQARRHKHNVERRLLKRALGDDEAMCETTTGDGDTVEGDALLQNGDVVLHTVHRHEIPIGMGSSGVDAVQLIAVRIRSDGLIAVNKPTGIPTHATGRYHFNSLLTVLEYVLAPKRLKAWLRHKDALLQSLVSTAELCAEEVQELYNYYSEEDTSCGSGETVALDKTPRPCYRLDKATSGLLLLGVSTESTSRVSTALMYKSRTMDEAVQRALNSKSDEKDGWRSDMPDISTDRCRVSQLLEATLGIEHGVRKRYLARVAGAFPFSSPRFCHLKENRADTAAGCPGESAFWITEPAMRTINETCCLPSMLQCYGRQASGCLEGVFPNAVLLTTPITGQPPSSNGSSKATSVTLPDASTSATHSPPPHPELLSAVTLCQCLWTTTVPCISSAKSVVESIASVVQCIPFTGRLHQIRAHLSDWGFPIEGDGSYRAISGVAMTPVELAGAPHVHAVHGEEIIYFKRENLPEGFAKNFVFDTARTKGAEGEPLCYECAGLLPVANFQEASGESAICLHAWEYELHAECPAIADDNCCGLERYVSRRGNAIVFRSPVPAWATYPCKAEEIESTTTPPD